MAGAGGIGAMVDGMERHRTLRGLLKGLAAKWGGETLLRSITRGWIEVRYRDA